LHISQCQETHKLPWFSVVEQEGAHEQVVYKKEIGLDHKEATPFASTMGFPQ
jgi:hypothetical protein